MKKLKQMFDDVFGRLTLDPDHSGDEDRFILMGKSDQFRMLIVCHCKKDGDSIRIISARKAEKFEKKQYEENRYA